MKEFIALGSAEPGEPMVTVEESEGKIVLDYFFPGFFLVDNDHEIAGEKMPFKQVIVSSAGSMCESGKPQIPSLGRYLQVPPGCDYDLSLDTGRAVSCDDVLVWPAQMKMTDAGDREHVFEFDKEFYSTDGLYPKEILQVRGPCSIGETNALLVHVAPLQYSPAKRQLVGYSNIKVTVIVKPRLEGNPDALPGAPDEREVFDNLFLNPGKGIEERLGFPPRRPFIKGSGPEFLIIYADILEFRQAAEKLADWKNSRGLLTEVVSLGSAIGSITNASGNMVADLKIYIRGRRASPFSGLRYVLLFGDTQSIEAETNVPSPLGQDNISDYYYSTQEDPMSPHGYLFPWLAIGRIPVANQAEALGVVDQIIDYEKNPPGDPDYYKRMVFTAAFHHNPPKFEHKDDSGFLETVEGIRSSLMPGYVGERVYGSNDPTPKYYQNGDPVPVEVMDAIFNPPDPRDPCERLVDLTSKGQLIICYRGHGYWNQWASPAFKNAHLSQVTGSIPSVFYSITCLTGQFDHSPECFAEENLKMVGAAPSLIAATRKSSTILNNLLIEALFDATFPGVLTTFPGNTVSFPVQIRRLGDILNYGKSYLPLAARTDTDEMLHIKNHPDIRYYPKILRYILYSPDIKCQFEVYHVIGDPTIELWTKFPGIITINASLTLDFIDIRLSTCPRNCVLTIWYKKMFLKRIEPLSTRIIFPTKNLLLEHSDHFSSYRSDLESNLRICCWTPDYRYCETKVKVE
jgi:hypothetical protein